MKFEIGNTVKVVADKERLEYLGVDVNALGESGEVVEIGNEILSYRVNFPNLNEYWWLNKQDLELVGRKSKRKAKATSQPETPSQIRKFATGATRDTLEGKLSYVKALSPIVLQRYVQYLDAHRLQPDGSMRDFDNWKKGIDIDAYFDGLGRHFVAVWLLQQGFDTKDNHGPVTLEDSLCAVIFNSMGWLFEILKEKENA